MPNYFTALNQFLTLFDASFVVYTLSSVIECIKNAEQLTLFCFLLCMKFSLKCVKMFFFPALCCSYMFLIIPQSRILVGSIFQNISFLLSFSVDYFKGGVSILHFPVVVRLPNNLTTSFLCSPQKNSLLSDDQRLVIFFHDLNRGVPFHNWLIINIQWVLHACCCA